MVDFNESRSNTSNTAQPELQLSFVFEGEAGTGGALARVSVDPLGDGISSVELINKMGSDADIVNAARVSYGKTVGTFGQKEKDLLKFLAENGHNSPFRHAFLSFRVKAPLFVARQWYKHIVGAEYAFKDTAWNEISQRYVEVQDFYYPEEWRFKKESLGDSQRCRSLHAEAVSVAIDTYNRLIDRGVLREQARLVLPLCVYTEFIWTASLQAVANFVEQRRSPHAQNEIRVYAEALHNLTLREFPESYTALTTYGV